MSLRAARVLSILFAGACSLVQEPQQPLGTHYVLRTIQGASLPSRYVSGSETWVMVSDTLELRDDGTGTFRSTIIVPQALESTRAGTDVRFTRSDNRIGVRLLCPINAVCEDDAYLIGTISATGIVFSESNTRRVPMVFDRLP